MINSPRPGSGRSGSNQGSRRPRVAGLRKRASRDSRAKSPDSRPSHGGQGGPDESGAVAQDSRAASSSADSQITSAEAAESEAIADTVSTDDAAAGQEGEDSSVKAASTTPNPSETDDSGAVEAEPDVGPEFTVVVRDGVGGVEPQPAETQAGEPQDAEPQELRSQVSGADDSGTTSVSEPISASPRAVPSGEPATRTGAGTVRGRPGLLALLVVLSVVCLALTLWFRSEARALTEEGPAANEALVDAPTTSEVNGQITDAVTKVFSYDFADTGKTEHAAKELLAGAAVKEHEQLFAKVKELAPQQKLVVTTTVKSSAVTRLQENRAELLVFVDQNSTRTDSGQSNVGQAQISVSAQKQGEQWKITKITQL